MKKCYDIMTGLESSPSDLKRNQFQVSNRLDVQGTLFFTITIILLLCLGSVDCITDVDLNSLSRARGAKILGAVADTYPGFTVSGAGDINGDYIDDIIVGVPNAEVSGNIYAGISYVIFGHRNASAFADIDLQNWVTSSSTGFRIFGAAERDFSGSAVSTAGDVNGDGYGDILIGASDADPSIGQVGAGISYVLFGHGVTTSFVDIDLSVLVTGPTTGFRILGSDTFDASGFAVSAAGDVNGDGLGDILIGAKLASPQSRAHAGISYLLFGRHSEAVADIDLSTMTAGSANSLGFRIQGATAGDNLGSAVSGAGDLNSDGFADFIIGAPHADPSGHASAGVSYVIFGHSNRTVFPDVDLSVWATSASSGFLIRGDAADSRSGSAVSTAGDVNGDGIADIIIGAPNAQSAAHRTAAGVSYVIFGRNSLTPFADVELSSWVTSDTTGFRVLGAAASDSSGFSVSSAGDVNADGMKDLVVGAFNASASGKVSSGAAYVVYGRHSFEDIDLSAFTASEGMGFTLRGAASGDNCGSTVSAAGDVNGDGVDDFLVVANKAAPAGRVNAGVSYLVYGSIMMPTSQPSSRPSRQPVSHPTSQPSKQPTSQPSLQLLDLNITSVQIHRRYAQLRLHVDAMYSANVYCGAFTGADIVSAAAIVEQNHTVFTGPGSVLLNVTDLIPSTDYKIHCMAIGTHGARTPLYAILRTRALTTTPCCREVRVGLKVHRALEDAAAVQAISVSIDSLPAGTLAATFDFAFVNSTDPYASFMYPVQLQWSGTGKSATIGPLDVILLPSGGGFQRLTAVLSGTSADIYKVKYTDSRILEVIVGETEPAVPVPLQALYSNDGASIYYSFDTPTDKGGYANTFTCTKLLTFAGVSSATCVWVDTSTIVIYPKYTTELASLSVGKNITVLPNNIRAECAGTVKTSLCSAWSTVVSKNVRLRAPYQPVSPTVIISSASALDGCSSLTVDLTNSVGAAGRPWDSVDFRVTVASVATWQALQLENYLNNNYTVNPPTRIPYSAFAKGQTYTIRATLCNFLGACGTSVTSVAVSASQAPVPVVTILGSVARSVYRNSQLVLNSNSYTQSCSDTISSANLQYAWTVRRLVAGGAYVRTGVRSVSQSPTVLRLLPYALNVSTTYEVALAVTTQQTPPQTATSTVTVTVIPSSVVAVLQGGPLQYMKVGDTLTLDASKSYDQDKQNLFGAASGLTFAWSCVQTSPFFSGSCPFTYKFSNSQTIPLTSSYLSLNTTTTFSVTVSQGGRTSTAQTVVMVSDTSKPKLAISSNLASLTNINTGKSFALLGSVQLVSSCSASWSVDDADVRLATAASTATTKQLLPAASASVFNLVMNAGALPQRATLVFSLSCGGATTSVTVTTNGAPLPGSFLVTPHSGSELSTQFTFAAQQWSDPDLPLTYQFGFVSETSLSNLVIVSKSEISFSLTTLPAGQERTGFQRNCTLDVYDSMSAFASVVTNVTVTAISSAEEKDTMLLALLFSNTGSVDSTKNILSVVSTALNAVNCTMAPNCTTINRNQCVRTSGECGSCITGYIGDAGDRSTMCIPASVAAEVGLNQCTARADCSEWEECDLSTQLCVTPLKTCSQSCSHHGSCIYLSRTTGNTLNKCRLVDIDCDAVCSCDDQYSGNFCEMENAALQTRRAVRSNLISSLGNLTQIDDINAESVSAWSASLYSLSIHPHELSESDVKNVADIANSTLYNAIALGVDSYADIAGVLQATDTVASLLKYNYNPNDYHDSNFNVKRNFENNTAAGTVNTVSAFADLVAQSMVLGQNATSFVYENFRMSVTISEASAVDFSVTAPASTAEDFVGAQPSSVLITPSDGAPSSVAVKVITVPPRSYRADTSVFVSTPLILQVQTQGDTSESPYSYLSNIEFTMQNVEPRNDYVVHDVLNYTTVCYNENIGVNYTYVCPVSEQVIEHSCTVAGTHVSYCNLPAPACAKLNVDTAEFAFLNSCEVVSYNATYTVCSCSLLLDTSSADGRRASSRQLQTTEENVLDDSGATCMMTSTVYIASGFADTFHAAGQFDSPSDAASVVVVIVMIGFIWVAGLVVILYEGFVQPMVGKNKIKADKNAADSSHQEGSVLSYVDSIIPSVFKEGETTRMQQLWRETIKHHLFFKVFAPSSARKRREVIFKTMTLFTLMLFLIAIFFDVSNPGDDGACKKIDNEETCLNRVSPFDSKQNFCKWSDATDDTAAACKFNSEAMTINALFYLTVLTTVLTALATIPLDYCFGILSAPTAKSLEGSSVRNVVTTLQAGVRRMSTAGAGTQPARIVPLQGSENAPRRKVMHILSADEVVVANRDIPEEVQSNGEAARRSLQLVTRNNQTMTLRNSMSTKKLQARSTKRQSRHHSKHKGKMSAKSLAPVISADMAGLRDGESASTNVDDLRVASTAAGSLFRDLTQQRMLMNDEAEETQLYDAQWGIVKNATPRAVDMYSVSPDARNSIRDSILSADEEAEAVKGALVNYTIQHAGLEILHLFMVDLLGRNTTAAKIFKEKFSEEFEDSRAVRMWQKVVAAVVVLALNAFFIYYVILKAFEKGFTWQMQFLVVFLLQFAVEILIFETTECIWLNFSVPSFVRQEVAAAIAKVHAHVDRVTHYAEDRQHKLDSKHTLVNAPAQLFVSVKVALEHPQLLESQIVSCYTDHLPGEISRTWPHYMAQVEEDEHYELGWLRPIVTGLSLSMQLFITVPYLYQRVSIRFVQPMIFSGISIVWFFAIGSPAGIGALCGLGILIVMFFVWSRYEAQQEAHQTLTIAPDVPQHRSVRSVPTFIDEADDHRESDAASISASEHGGVKKPSLHSSLNRSSNGGNSAERHQTVQRVVAGSKRGDSSADELPFEKESVATESDDDSQIDDEEKVDASPQPQKPQQRQKQRPPPQKVKDDNFDESSVDMQDKDFVHDSDRDSNSLVGTTNINNNNNSKRNKAHLRHRGSASEAESSAQSGDDAW